MKIQIDGETILTLSDTDIAALGNDLTSKTDWVKQALIGKINACKKRMIKEWQPKLFNDPTVESIPATEEAFIAMVIARPDYKNRVARDMEVEELKS